MKRLILLICVSLLTRFCYAQYSALLHPIFQGLSLDSKNVVTDFTYLVKGNEKVHLQWKVTNPEQVEFFSVERSANGKDFEIVEKMICF